MQDARSTHQRPSWQTQPPPPPTNGNPWQPLPAVRDDATRLLCGATHLDARFAGQVIGEFLSEPLRAVAPSPGVDSPAVLREAVAATTRRRLRDGTLAVLLLVVFFTNLTLFGMWLFAAGIWKTVGLRRRHLDGVARPRMELVPLGLVLLLGFLLGAAGILAAVVDVAGQSLGGVDDSTGGLLVRTTLSLLAGLVAGVVLAADRFMVWSMLSRSFQRGRFSPHPGGGEVLRTLGGNGALGRRLAGLPQDDHRNVVVYRGDKPFVGWGSRLGTWSITIPMEAERPENGSGAHRQQPAAFRLSELYDHIGADLAKLRQSSPALSPSYRLSALQQFETLMVPADDLIRHFGEEAANLVLARPDRRPVTQIDPAVVRVFGERPLEWMRYYRGFQVEGWDRELVVSLFVHVGADRDMLYFECTPCVLAPVSDSYRRIDGLADESSVAPFLDALGSLVVLPVSIFTRLAHAFRPTTRSSRAGGSRYTSDRYGARSSVREFAADRSVREYLKSRDLDRYVTLMQDRIFSATAEFLRLKGISSARFTERVRNIQNFYDQRNASFAGSAFGSGNTVVNNSAPGADVAAAGKAD